MPLSGGPPTLLRGTTQAVPNRVLWIELDTASVIGERPLEVTNLFSEAATLAVVSSIRRVGLDHPGQCANLGLEVRCHWMRLPARTILLCLAVGPPCSTPRTDVDLAHVVALAQGTPSMMTSLVTRPCADKPSRRPRP